ncbi:proline--tRNA ligase [Bradymonas sediminis]|uniref:Proline--tRNA ligase n=1 Tax=Bradymonas sediminis TaxID=1548548 RepID=A0A2Z4FQ77_9DELT|nr:proline--tRNA ligase [Bradymonas sediminis]AWV91113.1 proline--tRNA ligase [Bradymonas sediminis]TDP75144.1 prolyl-tRNA synthetase [Bradymonas sediminis]
MRLSNLFMPTRKEDPADAEVVSHKLLVRGAYIRMVTRGIYDFLPLGWKSVRKIEAIIREEMDRAGAQEVRLPAVQPAELWEESGRWQEYGPELLRFKDRKGSEYCLGPTHEEVMTNLIRNDVGSYKDLPLNLYQIQTKFRDETRPRFGLMRGREFIMKDAYSFDIDEESAKVSYQQMYDAYQRIFDRLGFEYAAVEADSGNIGGSLSHEFQVLAETGEDEIVRCVECDYAANVEKAETRPTEVSEATGEQLEMATVDTPGAKTIEEISAFLDVPASNCVKTLLFHVADQTVAVLVRGDHVVNEIKLTAFLREQLKVDAAAKENKEDAKPFELNMASDAQVKAATGAPVGFAGPVGLEIPVFADLEVQALSNFVVGANAADKHHTNVNHGRDFEVTAFADLRLAQAGDLCARCGGTFESHRGIEVGHVFYLGTKYSDAMGAGVQDQNGKMQSLKMGCYGIGVTRILAAVVEQNHDKNGIIWPMAIAPYQVIVLPLQMKNEEVIEAGEKIYAELQDAGIDVLLDDRKAGAGSKFKDADLVGIPVRIAIGSRGLKEGMVEVKVRSAAENEDIPLADAVEYIKTLVAQQS